ncbi:MAG: tripartite tricarboxylate transporter TctB family protein [Proteobacteria bacterium]|nr:tripartite tricarboxylate transporter TctB family protein [Pseudomonadota bacterium]
MRVSNTAIGLGVIIFAVAVILYARNFPSLEQRYPGPALFPTLLAVLFILAGITMVVQGFRSGEKLLMFDIREVSRSGFINILLVLATILFYIFLADFLGFHITSFLILFFLMKRLNVSTRWSLVMSGGVTLAIYALFAKMLLVPLPLGLWGW